MKDKTVIFDMDGLLVNSEPFWRKSLNVVFGKMDIRISEKDYTKNIGLPTAEIVEYWSKYYDWGGRTDKEVNDEIIETGEKLIIEGSELMEGVLYILDFFKERDFKMGLASSSPMSMIDAVLDHFELKEYFQTLHSGEDEDYGKPHPAVYLSAAKALNTDPVDCLVFEDSVNGMIAGKAAKMNVAAVPEEHNRDDPRYSVANLRLGSLKDFNEDHLEELRN